jgi:hypothetical protein
VTWSVWFTSLETCATLESGRGARTPTPPSASCPLYPLARVFSGMDLDLVIATHRRPIGLSGVRHFAPWAS